MIIHVKFCRCKIVNVRPVIIPQIKLGLFHLSCQLYVRKLFRNAGKSDIAAALNNRLTLAKYSKSGFKCVSDSKLLAYRYNSQALAIPDKDARLARTNENIAVFTLINVYAGRGIQYINVTFFAI